ncbi:hypothetical protein [Mucilaginibacter sp.]
MKKKCTIDIFPKKYSFDSSAFDKNRAFINGRDNKDFSEIKNKSGNMLRQVKPNCNK